MKKRLLKVLYLLMGYRRLRVTVSGRWYLLLTISIGVTAISSGNNSLYLMESFLLGGFILSGILSERIIYRVKVEWVKREAFAETRSQDFFQIENESAFPVYSLSIGIWRDDEFSELAFIESLKPREKRRVQSKEVFGTRGTNEWNGFGHGTDYPFGFAKKITFEKEKGSRVIYPKPLAGGTHSHSTILERREGEVQLWNEEDSWSEVIATKVGNGDELFSRARGKMQDREQLILKTNEKQEAAFEAEISDYTSRILKSEVSTLLIFEGSTRVLYQKRTQMLEALALVSQGAQESQGLRE